MYDRDAIIAAVDLRALADELLGPHHGGDRSPTWRCPNPHHAQTGHTPPVSVFNSRRGEQRWRCHGCGEGGTAIDLVIACNGVDLRQALDDLARRAGHVPQSPNWERQPRRRQDPSVDTGECRDARGLDAYVTSCARLLWRPEGRPVRRWLMKERGLPEPVLRANKVGADLGPRRQARPEGMAHSSGAVLPVVSHGRVIYAQLRVQHATVHGARYLNPTADLAPNPRLARFRPSQLEHREVIITEGSIDALSAASAGYRAVAVLSAGYTDRSVALALSRLPYPLVIAFDADDAGRAGAERLQCLLATELRPAANLDLGHGDLNDALVRTGDWMSEFPERVDVAESRIQRLDPPSLAR